MYLSFRGAEVKACTKAEKSAAEIFTAELVKRLPTARESGKNVCCFTFNEEKAIKNEDMFIVSCGKKSVVFTAAGVRGFIFAMGLFFRKAVYSGKVCRLVQDISGRYCPDKRIRGHQLGYRAASNTYDKWGIDEYKSYCTELMFFGANTVEFIPYEKGFSNRNEIMRFDEQELLCAAADRAAAIGLKVSVWYPNSENSEAEALKNREKLFSQCKNIDYVFCPGSDPGSLPADEFISRCKKIKHILKKYHPAAELWPSAQQPHEFAQWGSEFAEEMQKLPDEIDGVITGPNAAFSPDELRKILPQKYPIRLYPDITHNLRCEYPVHFESNDWHYSLAAANGRESINPRPAEYKKIHMLISPYAEGSVTYSEGINDDINKAVWSALDFDPSLSAREIIEDYSRLFFPGTDFNTVTDGIFGLEKNWCGPPDENPDIEATLKIWLDIGRKTPAMYGSWRYTACLFRAECDAFIRRKLLFEKPLIKEAARLVMLGNISGALSVLNAPLTENILNIKKDIEINAEKLYNIIGLQLSVGRYHASGAERGAVLDTVDLPVTDRLWLKNKLTEAAAMEKTEGLRFAKKVVNRNRVAGDEYYYSAALDGFSPGGALQAPGFYPDFQGDFPEKNNGTLPTCLFQLFDHFIFRCKAGGLQSGIPYVLQVTYKNKPNKKSTRHTVKINGKVIYRGGQFGGKANKDFERDMLPEGYTAVMYAVPAGVIINGCAEIEISEPLSGFETAELRITKREYSSETEEL